MISSDQRSPNISSEILTGQPDRGFDFGFPGTFTYISNITCGLQVILRRFNRCGAQEWRHADASILIISSSNKTITRQPWKRGRSGQAAYQLQRIFGPKWKTCDASLPKSSRLCASRNSHDSNPTNAGV